MTTRTAIFVDGHAHGQFRVVEARDTITTVKQVDLSYSTDPIPALAPTMDYVDYTHRAHIPALDIHVYGEAGTEITHHQVVDALATANLPGHYAIHWGGGRVTVFSASTWLTQEELGCALDPSPPPPASPPLPDSWDDEPFPEDLTPLAPQERTQHTLAPAAQPHAPDLPRGQARTFSHSHANIPHPADVLEEAEEIQAMNPSFSLGRCIAIAQERYEWCNPTGNVRLNVNPTDHSPKPKWSEHEPRGPIF